MSAGWRLHSGYHSDLPNKDPDMAIAQKKGKDLEYAVRRIEESILAHNPSFAGANATIEQNKIVNVSGSRHEIDLWMVLHPGTHHEFIHIVECKNWKKPVGTKEVLALAGKRDEVGAHAASLIATKVSKDAKLLAEKHRIKVVLVTEFPLWEIAAPLISHKTEGGEISVTYRHRDPDAPTKLALDEECEVDGQSVVLSKVVDSMIGAHLQKTTGGDPRRNLPGIHTGSTSFHYPIRPERFFVGGREIAAIAATVQYSAAIHFPTIRLKLAIQGRGGICKLDYPPGAYDGQDLALEIITKPI